MDEQHSFFDGSVDDAIAKVMRDKLFLLVFVHGDDDISKKYEKFLTEDQAIKDLTKTFVRMRLAIDSDAAHQLSVYYPVVTVPTLYIISASGVALEAIIGDRGVDEFRERIERAIATDDGAASAAAAASSSQPAAAQDETSAEAEVAAATAAGSDEDWDTRVEKVQRKIEEKQRLKQQEEAEKQREAERQRREAGRSLAQLRDKQEAERQRAWAEEVRLERQAKYRQLRQKQLEREEGKKESASGQETGMAGVRASSEPAAAAAAAAPPAAEAAPAAAAAVSSNSSSVARVQFRCSDGRQFVREFAPSDRLSDLRLAIANEVKGQFRLATVYPRRVFNEADSARSLSELDLAPSCSLLVLPPVAGQQGYSSAIASVYDSIWGLLHLLLIPIVLLYNFVRSMLGGDAASAGGDAAAQQQPQQQQQQRQAAAGAAANRAAAAAGAASGSTVTRRGNTARLHDLPRDDDDDGNTWNGNSTQQM